MTFESSREFVALFCVTLIAATFVMSGSAKVFNLRSFVATLRAFELLPDSLAGLAGYVLPFTELMLGLLLLVDVHRVVLLGFAIVLLFTFTLAIAANLIRGRSEISCGCFGSKESRLTWFLVIRNLLVIGVALTASLTDAGSVSVAERSLVILTVASLIASYHFYGLIVKFWQPRF